MMLHKHLFRLAFRVPHDHADAFAGAIEPYFDSVAWTTPQGQTKSEVTGYSGPPPNEKLVIHAITITAEAMSVPIPEIRYLRIPVKNWVLENLKQFPAISVGRFFIYGSDFDGKIPISTIPLNVPAGAAFGTGEHSSTQGCLVALEKLTDRSIQTALDMGCGSGILAIAIAKRWRCRVTASDADLKAVNIAKRNAITNGERHFVQVLEGRGYYSRSIRRRQFDLIISNLFARSLAKMSFDLSRCLAPGGTAVLSGLLDSQQAQVLMAHRMQGLSLRRRIKVDGWSTLVLRKNSLV